MKRIIASAFAAGAILAGGTACSSNTPAPTVTVTKTVKPPAFDYKERAYLQVVHDKINVPKGTSDKYLVNLGHGVCDTLDNGATVDDIFRAVHSEYPDSNPTVVGTIVGAAVGAFCPQYIPQLKPGSDA